MASSSSTEPGRPPGPAGYALDRRLRRLGGLRLLLGGDPPRFVRLSDEGERSLAKLAGPLTAAPPGPPGPAERRLLDRLVDGGLVQPRPPPRPELSGELTVVVPVRDDAAGLERLLERLGRLPAVPSVVVVVDDGSRPDEARRLAAAAEGAAARLVRLAAPLGPGGARNAGLAEAATDYVAFVDADVVPDDDALGRLLGHFDDPGVVAVAPRVVAGARPGAPAGAGGRRAADRLLAYERGRSPLDLGGDPGPVGPGRRLRYVPGALLVARRRAVAELGGFDESLRYGEDVDLVWRLCAAGGTVRYDPAARAEHAVRQSARGLARQRFAYGTSAAPLAGRHRGAVRAFEAPGASAAVLAGLAAAVLVRRPPGRSAALAAAGAVAGSQTLRLARRLDGAGVPDAGSLAAVLVAGSLRSSLAGLRSALRRPWWPVAAVVLAVLARRRAWWSAAAVAAFVGAAPAAETVPGTGASYPTRLWLGGLDDVSYGTGVLAGAALARRLGALLPGPPPRRS